MYVCMYLYFTLRQELGIVTKSRKQRSLIYRNGTVARGFLTRVFQGSTLYVHGAQISKPGHLFFFIFAKLFGCFDDSPLQDTVGISEKKPFEVSVVIR
jgi:hypothetical protein